MKLVLERQIQLAFVCAFVLLLVVGFFTYRNARSMSEAVQMESHTREVLLQLEDTLKLAIDAETGGRGFIITGNDEFLAENQGNAAKISRNLTDLRTLVSDNPKQIIELDNLEKAVNEKNAFGKMLIDVRRNQGIESTSRLIDSGQGRQIMDAMRVSGEKMKDEEQMLLQQREADLNKSIVDTMFFLFFGTGAGIVSIGLANWAIFREVRKRRRAQDELRIANKDLEKRVEQRMLELTEKNEELKEQIKQREQSENRRRIALEAGSLGTWILNPKTNRAEIDERSLALFGLVAEDFDGSGEKAFSRIHEEDLPTIEQLFQKTILERANFDAEFRVNMPDGAVRWNQCHGQPQLDENGELTHIIGHCRDVTENKRGESVLRESEFFNRSILDSLSAHIAVIDKDGVITAVNQAWQNFARTNCPEEQIDSTGVGQNYLRVCRNGLAFEKDMKEVLENLQGVLKKEKTGFAYEYPCHSPNDERWFILQVSAMRGAAGGAVISHIDITDRKKAEREREELLKREQTARRDAEIANRIRDEFLATVSHELRAPLSSILGWARLMEKGKLDEPTRQKAVGTIVRNAESQNRLIEDLLDVSRIISGKLRLEVITVKPINVVESALETVRPAAEAKGIKLEIKETPDVSHIAGDPNRLQQVIWNLLSNAIKFTPNGGEVSVGIERKNDYTEIKVTDSGVGIKDEFLPHVFDRFRQADTSSIRKFGGLGLGLAIVRHITEMHGGTVSVESSGENKGSTFTVRLPILSSVSEDDKSGTNEGFSQNSEPAQKFKLDGLLILVVDDEKDTRQLLVQALTFHGATIETAASVQEALHVIEAKNPDVLVSDIGMPDEDGYSLIRKVRALADAQHKNIPAVALTAFTRAQDRMRALSAGYQNHVSKPVDLDELATVIASLTGRLQMNDEG